ncbi:hypothetical protein C8R45DRAFT_1103623 [Mycena sanguinolenta]|nr:hypothetical protein C8R45DRAFT_1103623 [Mycena sanguinolenta]
MAATFNCSLLPNPFAPNAFLPPNIVHAVQTAAYILVGTMGAFVWTILSNLVDDYKLLAKTKFTIGTATYLLSKYKTLPFCVANHWLDAQAIFDSNPYFVSLLFCTWLSILGTNLTIPVAVKGSNLGPTDFCLTVSATKYVGGAAVTTTLHNTLVFLAISCFKPSVWAFVSGQYLPQFLHAVLQDGQLYYLLTVASSILALIMFYNTSVQESYNTMLTVPNLMMANFMACQVFPEHQTRLPQTSRDHVRAQDA